MMNFYRLTCLDVILGGARGKKHIILSENYFFFQVERPMLYEHYVRKKIAIAQSIGLITKVLSFLLHVIAVYLIKMEDAIMSSC